MFTSITPFIIQKVEQLYNIKKNIMQYKSIHMGMGLNTNNTVWALYSQLINETSLRIENTTEPQIVLVSGVCVPVNMNVNKSHGVFLLHA